MLINKGHLGLSVVEPHKFRHSTGIVGSLLETNSYEIFNDAVRVSSKLDKMNFITDQDHGYKT